jgi:hypothetical protein
MADLILRPAGVPPEIYQPLLYKRDEITGRQLSKRQIAPLIISGIESRPDCSGIIRRIIEIAADWSSFHLAHDEYAARATVQKARALLGQIEVMEEREAKQREFTRRRRNGLNLLVGSPSCCSRCLITLRVHKTINNAVTFFRIF